MRVNQLQVLLNHLLEAKSYRDQISNISAYTGWSEITGLDSRILLCERMNQLISITLSLHKQILIESELNNDMYKPDEDWVNEILKGLSIDGVFATNIDGIHKHTLSIVRSNIRNWNHGYTVRSTLDSHKILALLNQLEEERNNILNDTEISFDLRRVLIIEIDKLVFCLKNYEVLGEEYTKEAITDFYSEAFFNKDIKEYYQKTPTFKDAIDQVCAAITIGTFTSPVFSNLLEAAQNTVQSIPQ